MSTSAQITSRSLWQTIAINGYCDDLIPVIPPQAEFAVGVKDGIMVGKVPGRCYPNNTWAPWPNWQRHVTTAAEATRFGGWNGNMGLILRRCVAIDIDDEDSERVGKIVKVVVRRVGGSMALRWRPNSARVLLLFERPPAITAKRRLDYTTSTGERGSVELLGVKNQAVIYGMHPSGAFYEWSDLSPEKTRLQKLPLYPVSGDLMEDIAELVRSENCITGGPRHEGNGVEYSTMAERLPLGHPDLLAPDFNQAGRALMAIPNTPMISDQPNRHTASYGQVVGVIASYIGAVGGDSDAINASLIPWLEQWPSNTETWIEERIASFRDGTSVGVRQLFDAAKSWGFDEVLAGTFTTVPQAVVDPPAKAAETVPRVSGFNTDAECAALFIHRSGDTISRDASGSTILCWDQGRRSWRGAQGAYDPIRAPIGRFLHGLAQQCDGKGAAAEARRLGSSRTAAAVRTEVLQRLPDADWRQNPDLLNTPGGVVNLRTGSLRPARPQDHLLGCTAIAPGNPEDLPTTFIAGVRAMFPYDPVKAELLLDWCALCVWGGCLDPIALFLVGEGREGKSALLQILAAVLGAVERGGYALMVNKPDAFDHRLTIRMTHNSALARMQWARMVAFGEVEKDFQPNLALLKSFISREDIAVRQPGEREFGFVPTASLTFASNHEPRFLESNQGTRRRFLLLRLHQRFANDGGAYVQKAISEGPQILRLLIDRCHDLINGRETYFRRESWAANAEIYKAISRESARVFDLSQPLHTLVAAMLEPRKGSNIMADALLRQVQDGLAQWRQEYDGPAPALDRLVDAFSEDKIRQLIGMAVSREFGVAGFWDRDARARIYKGLAFRDKPTLPFSVSDV